MLSRRNFIASVSLSPWGAQAAQDRPAIGGRPASRPASRPLVISSDNGIRAVEKAMLVLKSGGNTLDAVVEGVTLVEDDPEDQGVGLGGLPNAEGEVELDASVMYGPTGAAGAVGALKSIRNPAKVARLVMQRTTRVFLVGEGALRFALAHGFQRENLLTEKSRLAWLKWKEELSGSDDWVAPPSQKVEANRPQGTINCLAIDSAGDMSGVTTTSGLAFKPPGRVGDSPIIGAGLYVDNGVGAAGATGNGEANIRVVGAHTVVELMRQGKAPEQACMETLKRVVDLFKGNPPQLNFYAVNKKGESGAASIYKGAGYCLHDGALSYRLKSAWLLDKKPT
ncbi:MAG TPA: N(4)-(beta-N-acetylglucosaminyl)-L-asparaginase [Terriglobia bacterium]|nr:N(4)-(beta-N-acetylglucosaminyl)-L-asparaginase [Terriglobia bacterium]